MSETKKAKSGIVYCTQTGTILEGLQVGSVIWDDLAGKSALVVKIFENNGVKLDSDYLEGLRHSWELSVLPEDMVGND